MSGSYPAFPSQRDFAQPAYAQAVIDEPPVVAVPERDYHAEFDYLLRRVAALETEIRNLRRGRNVPL